MRHSAMNHVSERSMENKEPRRDLVRQKTGQILLCPAYDSFLLFPQHSLLFFLLRLSLKIVISILGLFLQAADPLLPFLF